MFAPPSRVPILPHALVPDERIESAKPSVARVHAALLGQGQRPGSPRLWTPPCTPADRALADRIHDTVPGLAACLQRQEDFRNAVVTAAARQGICQFVELRPQYPTSPRARTVHELAREHGPRKPETLLVPREHGVADVLHRALRGEAGVIVHPAPVHDVTAPLAVATGLLSLDPRYPVCLLMISDLQHWPGDPALLLAKYRDGLPAGSWVAISDLDPGEPGTDHAAAMEVVARHYDSATEPLCLRDRAQVEDCLEGWDIPAPGPTTVDWWPRPFDGGGTEPTAWCVVARRSPR